MFKNVKIIQLELKLSYVLKGTCIYLLYVVVSPLFCFARCLDGIHQCAFLFSWDPSSDLMSMLWLYVEVKVYDVLFPCSFIFSS
jgi:hypothetical protein